MIYTILIPRWQIQRWTRDLAQLITRTYGCNLPVFMVVLEGAKPFAAELLQHFQTPEVVHVRCRSYVGTERKAVTIDDLPPDVLGRIKGREVLIIEDIIDSGKTVEALVSQLQAWGAKRTRAVAMLNRYNTPTELPILGVLATLNTKEFVIGFGLDLNGQYREYENIYVVRQERKKT